MRASLFHPSGGKSSVKGAGCWHYNVLNTNYQKSRFRIFSLLRQRCSNHAEVGQLNKALSPLPSSPSHSADLSVISQHGIAEMQRADRKAQLLCAFCRRCGFSAASSLEKSHKEPWLLLWMVYHWIESSQKQVKKKMQAKEGKKE